MMLQFLAMTSLFAHVYGHGRLISPPGRSTMWRYGYHTPPNYNDNQLFCGGFFKQWTLNDGKCGVCGDPWDGPRENEAGGKYASGIIVGNYTAGQLLEVKLDITASHKGFHEFRLCPVGSPQTKATRECFDQNVLKLQNGETKFNEPGATGTYSVKLVLPETLTCTQCVLQWKWNTGNSYGCDKENNCCIGCGPQEQFYGCADIAISSTSAYNTNHGCHVRYSVTIIACCILSLLSLNLLS